jgi:hypothetical protein
MRDPGWGGDMWDPNTPSGKPVGTYPRRTPQGWQWPTEADRQRERQVSERSVVPHPLTFVSRAVKAFRILTGKDT